MNRTHDLRTSDEGLVCHGSRETPLLVEETRPEQSASWEHARISEKIGGYEALHQSSITVGSCRMNRIVVKAVSGEVHVFYFDLSLQQDAAAPARTSGPTIAHDRRTRHMILWKPEFETGESRFPVIQAVRKAWSAKSAKLVTQREIMSSDTKRPEVVAGCAKWLKQTFGKDLKKSKLAVIHVTDPEWEIAPAMFEKHVAQMSEGKPKSRMCVLGLTFEGKL